MSALEGSKLCEVALAAVSIFDCVYFNNEPPRFASNIVFRPRLGASNLLTGGVQGAVEPVADDQNAADLELCRAWHMEILFEHSGEVISDTLKKQELGGNGRYPDTKDFDP